MLIWLFMSILKLGYTNTLFHKSDFHCKLYFYDDFKMQHFVHIVHHFLLNSTTVLFLIHPASKILPCTLNNYQHLNELAVSRYYGSGSSEWLLTGRMKMQF